MSTHTGASFVQMKERHRQVWNRCNAQRALGHDFCRKGNYPCFRGKSPQWTTLWTPHAEALVAIERNITRTWFFNTSCGGGVVKIENSQVVPVLAPGRCLLDRFRILLAIDAIWLPYEMAMLGLPLHSRVLAFASFDRPFGLTARQVIRRGKGHPITFNTVHAVGVVAKAAYEMGFFFARKAIADSQELIDLLISIVHGRPWTLQGNHANTTPRV